MAQIPMGNFGQARVVPDANVSRVDNSPLNVRGRGMAAVGDALTNVAERGLAMEQQRIAREQAEAEQLARAKAANAMLDDQLEQQGKLAEIKTRIADGSLPYDKAPEEYQTWLSQREAPQVDGLDPVGYEHLQGSLKRNRATATAELDGVVQTARRADGVGQIAKLRDNLGKLAGDPNADVDKIVAQGEGARVLADKFNVGATFDKDHQAWADRVYSDNAKARFVAGRDDPAALDALEHDLTADDGRYAGKLDADKKTSVLSLIQTRRAQLEAKSQHEADKAEATAERALGQFEKYIGQPAPPPLEFLTDVADKVRAGTPEQQERYKELLAGEAQVRQVLQKSPAEQAAFVQAERARQTREGATLQQQTNLQRIETAVEQGAKQLRESPLEYFSARTGTAIAPLDIASIATGDVAPLQRQIAERMNVLATMKKQLGPTVGSQPLLPQEAEAFAGIVQKLPPEQLTATFGKIRQLFGDDRTYLAALGQIAKDAPVRAQAGALATWNPKGALLVLKGQALLDRSTGEGKGAAFPMPPDKDFHEEFARHVGEAFRDRPEAYAQAMQVARAAYAGAAATDGDVKGDLDMRRLRNAINAAVGVPVKFNGADVLAPPGMREDTFEDAIDRAYRAAPKPKDAGDLSRYQLRQYGANSYRLVRGRQFLIGPNGQPVTLQVGL